jgi:hypothetical protein
MPDAKQLILFEPWNMGDALIAAAIALQDPSRLTLACNSRWHPLLRAATADLTPLELISVDLDYINRNRKGRLNSGSLNAISKSATEVATIRGDIRDYRAAKKLFPNARIHSSGWLTFAARRSALLDFPYAKAWLPIRNRYHAWATIASVPWQHVEHFYQQKPATPPSSLITIHIGAQWRSKQYPHAAKLAEFVAKTHSVQILAAPNDPLPDGIAETEVRRLIDRELIEAFRISTHIIVNDSGPMHLAALLRCHTHPIVRASSVDEWLPPTVTAIKAKTTPKGYRPHPGYTSDSVLEGWPSPEDIVRELHLN